MIDAIRREVLRRGITRLCHFTPSRNLMHIYTGTSGLLASQRLSDDERSAFNPTDRERWDSYPDHVCCSIQYPNGWYFRQARSRERLFRDWVVLLLDPKYLWLPSTKFCSTNAATGRGAGIREGLQAFHALFAPEVSGASGQVFKRESKPDCVPTDDQAEVLIPGRIELEALQGFAVSDAAQARRETARLRRLGQDVPRILIAPAFFNRYTLSEKLRAGELPVETHFHLGGSDA